jgi:biopolymer transport protein ExbD
MRKHSSAAKRAQLRSQPEEDPEFQIAPMIDILLVLLVFFMSISSTEILQTNDKVKLPVAKDAGKKDKANPTGQTIVNILWNPLNNVGTVDVDEKVYPTPDDIVPLLQAKMNANPAMRVVVRADKQARYEYVKQLLKAIGTAGASNVTFSVVDKDPGAAAPAAAGEPAAP